MEKAKLTLIIGGVRSGKSRLAEEQAVKTAKRLGGRLHYIACGTVTDEEMAQRVRLHQKQRQQADIAWTTWEQPTQLDQLSDRFNANDVILVDCLTTLVTNEWFSSSHDEAEWEQPVFHTKIKQRVIAEVNSLRQAASEVIIVSNELVFEPLSSPLVFFYAKTLGELHQYFVSEADTAIVVEHGFPLLLKGGDER
ncbi:bifunctional adenosylcobinamide kinase/adenosylcobinamide-phosphate guanylyltransferase [Bacillus sp. REN10]|uniref:bifunctional adenosylcobinamide kinase/adenosylcobinamide-phosphate guanylyltransferase n=1 Tax=Bacillus sp. REN10 TaxID=2782541 RepID=UPI00193B6DF2|nr:bifunctional adenosylcobinamide kinase/adenosylcobinamide-phosphate guanylyltransferase [Bacillus sp. REN10]